MIGGKGVVVAVNGNGVVESDAVRSQQGVRAVCKNIVSKYFPVSVFVAEHDEVVVVGGKHGNNIFTHITFLPPRSRRLKQHDNPVLMQSGIISLYKNIERAYSHSIRNVDGAVAGVESHLPALITGFDVA